MLRRRVVPADLKFARNTKLEVSSPLDVNHHHRGTYLTTLNAQAPKDLSCVSLFIRITRGLHVAESGPALPSLRRLDGDSGGKGDSVAKRSAAAWSWRWEETVLVPRLEAAGANVDIAREAGDGSGGREKLLADQFAVADHNNEEFRASTGENGIEDTSGTPPRTAVTTSVAVTGGDVPDNLPGDGDPSSGDIDEMVASSRGWSPDSSGTRRASTTMIDDDLSWGGRSVAEASSPKADDGAKVKRGVSFWSPRRGRRKTNGTSRDKQSSGAGASKNNGGALPTTPYVALVTGDERPGSSASSIDSETSDTDAQGNSTEGKVRGGTPARSTSSSESCPEAPVTASNNAVAEGVTVEDGACPGAADCGVTTKKVGSFWSPRWDRRNHTSEAAIDELSRCDSEASTVFDISDPDDNDDVTTTDNKASPGPVGESNTICVPKASLRNKTVGSFWSPRRKGNGGGKNVETGSHARSDPAATATTGLRDSVEVASKPGKWRGQSARRRRRAPSKASAPSDVMLLELWQVQGAAAMSTCPKNDAIVTATNCSDCNGGVGASYTGDSEETITHHQPALVDGMGDTSYRCGSAEEPLTARASEQTQPVDAMAEAVGDRLQGFREKLEAAPGSRGSDTVLATEGGCVDGDRIPVIGNGITTVDDKASSAGTTSTKNARRKRPILFPSARKDRKAKGEGPSKLPSSGPSVASSETGTPRGSLLAAHGNDDEEGGRREAATPRENGEREISETALEYGARNVPGESSTDGEHSDGDASTTKKQAQTRRKPSIFLSSYKGRKTTKDRTRSAANLKPVLWGRVTIRVADVLLAGRRRSADNDVSLIDKRDSPRDGAVMTPSVPLLDRLPVRSAPMLNSRDLSSSSVFGMSLTRRGPRKRSDEETGTLGSLSAGDQLDDDPPGLSLHAADPSAVDGWFEVEHPKGKQGKRAKGRLRLTITS